MSSCQTLVKINQLTSVFAFYFRTSFGDDYFAEHVKTREKYVVKAMELSKCLAALIVREWKVMKRVGRHPYIVGHLGSFATRETIYFCSEPMEGGRLFDRLLQRGIFAEVEARSPFRNLASAVAHMHSHNVVHRDIKVRAQSIGLLPN